MKDHLSKFYGFSLTLMVCTATFAVFDWVGRLGFDGAEVVDEMAQMRPDQRENFLRRWNGVLHEVKVEERVTATDASPLIPAVFLGLSTLRDGIDIPLVKSRLGFQPLSLTGSGGSVKVLEYGVAPLFADPRFRAKVGVIFLHPMWLAGWNPIIPSLAEKHSKSVKSVLVDLLVEMSSVANWFFAHRTVFAQAMGVLTSEMRDYFYLHLLGVPFEKLYKIHPHPWAQAPIPRKTFRLAPEKMEHQWLQWEGMGKMNVKVYEEQMESQLDSLGRILSGAGRRVDQWFIVVMAEHSRLRSRVPSIAKASLDSKKLTARFNRSIKVWDSSGLLSDNEFFDYAHPNEKGRRRLTDELIRRLKALGVSQK